MTQATSVPTVMLHDGVGIPQLGFGVFQVPPEKTQETVERALEVGYRHIDTAAAYRNERGVGAAIAAAGVPREEIFVTTKLWNSSQGYEPALGAFEKSIARLGLDHVDLYLIHWPVPAEGRALDSWRAFERIQLEGRARTIGVSNFRVEDLEMLEREAEALPTVNQIELHPHLQQAELREWHADRGVATEAWSPLAQAQLLSNATVAAVASRRDRTPAQVILRWHLQLGNVVIPKSATPARIRENFALFDFELSDGDMTEIAALDVGKRIGPDPASFA
ncbi:MAG TPA: aldo/keto reductase [Solirubrobacterales bacterium]|nr:aldo/keto reductase [Solirubrobacterales bacterium]